MQALTKFTLLMHLVGSFAYAGESIRIDCMNLVVEKEADTLQISLGDKSYTVGGSSGSPNAFAKFLDDLTMDSIGNPQMRDFVSLENNSRFIEATDQVLGATIFSEAEKATIEQTKTEISDLISKRFETVSQKTNDIKNGPKRMSTTEVWKQVRAQLNNDADFIWTDLQIKRKKAELATTFQNRLQPLGIDLYAGPQLEAGLKRLDPFEIARMSRKKFPLRNGERVLVNFGESYLQKKFVYHANDFDPPLKSAREYSSRILRLAYSEDPRTLSYVSVPTASDPRVSICKYDPETHEYLIVRKDTGDLISFYRVMPRSYLHPRGYKNTTQTPLQYFLNTYYSSHVKHDLE